jgi:pyrroline-5-carboxylate reductase
MQNPTIGFIGGGRIVSIFLAGWKRAGAMPADIVISEPNPAVLTAVQAAHPGVRSAEPAQAAGQDVVFLAVHPPLFKDVLPALRPALRPHAIVISLAPKFTTAKIAEMLGGFARVARAIPNAPSLVGSGYNPVSFSPSLPAADRGVVTRLLRPLGECPEVAESKLEAYAILTAMGPTYLWYQLYELLALGESFGLTRAEAETGVARMLAGAMETIARSGLPPEQVKDLIPVKPLADIEPTVAEAYRNKLTAVMEKIKP